MRVLILFLIFLLVIPIVYSIQTITVREGDFVKLKTEAFDPDEDLIRYKYSKPLDSEGEWQTDFDDAGTYFISIAVTDGKDEVAKNIRLRVLNVNRKPQIKLPKIIEVDEGDFIDFNLKPKDLDGDKINYKISEPIGNDGIWHTGFFDAGEYNVNLEASDGKKTVSQEILIVVNNIDREPSFEKIQKIIEEDSTLRIDLETEDLDKDKIIYGKFDLIPGMSFDGSSLIWKIPFDFVVKQDSKKLNIEIPATVLEKSYIQSIEIIVINKNRAPVIEVNDKFTISEGESLKIKPLIRDPDGDNIDVQLSGDFNSLDIKTNFNSAGKYSMKITASDGDLITTKSFTLNVKNVNQPPKLVKNYIVIPEAKKSEIPLKIVDLDGQKVKIKKAELPEGATLSDGKIIWTPGFDFVEHKFGNAPSFIHGILNLILKTKFYERSAEAILLLDDGEDIVEEKIKIVVQDINRKPIVDEEVRTFKIKEGETAFVPVLAKDEDGDKLFYGYKGFFGPVAFNNPGTENVDIVISDGTARAIKTSPVEIEEVKKPPRIIVGNKYTVKENETIEIPIKIYDSDGEETRIFTKPTLSGAEIINNVLIWKPSFDEVQHKVLDEESNFVKNPDNFKERTITIVSEDSSFFVEQDIIIKIIDQNRLPELLTYSPTEKFKVKRGQVMEFFVNAEDPDGDELTYTWSGELFRNYIDDNRHIRKLNSVGRRGLKVKINDGFGTIEKEWDFLVKN